MSDEARERALLAYLSSDQEDHQRYRSLTTIYEQFDRPDQWKSSYASDADIDDKEALRSILDEMVLDGLVEGRMGDRDYERSYRLSDQGLYEVFAEENLVVVDNALKEEAAVLQVDSKKWTGLPSNFELSESKREALISLLTTAEDALDSVGAGNSEKAMARAYIIAARTLADAPEPPVDLIWELIARANSIAGIAALLVSIIALFSTAPH